MSAAQKQDFLERFKGSKQKNGRPVLSEVVDPLQLECASAAQQSET